ncbi:MAG: hypothetical protein ABJC39_04835 [Chloroflexota bacterium]
MTINLLRGKVRSAATGLPNGLAIGETDAHVFNCPACQRPLANGTSRCPGCGARLIMGVRVRRAAGILGLGMAIGVIVGGGLTAVAIGLELPGRSAAADAGTVPVEPLASASATSAPAIVVPPPVAGASSSALAALIGTAVVNGRISVDAATLSSTLARKNAEPIEIARALRSLSADATLGLDLVGRLGPWHEAKPVMTDLDAFYQAIASTARDGLRASFSDAASYRRTGKAMEAILPRLGTVDASSRGLATTVHLELPPVVLPKS